MHVGLEALRAASVPVVVIGDFDVLNEWPTLSRLVIKAGGEANQFESDWRTSLAPVREALKIESGWDRVKNTGMVGVPKGDPYNAAVRLLDGLRELGIFLVPIGEMEDFAPSVDGHGPGWLSDVLEQGIHESPELFDGNGNYVRTNKSAGKFKGVETRNARKPPRAK